jgi:hypothetical protein
MFKVQIHKNEKVGWRDNEIGLTKRQADAVCKDKTERMTAKFGWLFRVVEDTTPVHYESSMHLSKMLNK